MLRSAGPADPNLADGEGELKIIARRERCAGHARCAATAPEIYSLDDDGYIAFAEKDVPPGREQEAARGARACPERVLSLVEG